MRRRSPRPPTPALGRRWPGCSRWTPAGSRSRARRSGRGRSPRPRARTRDRRRAGPPCGARRCRSARSRCRPGARPRSSAARSCRTRPRTRARSPPRGRWVDRGQEADLAVVDREHRHAGAGVAAQRGQDRAVAAEDDAEVDVVAQLGDDLDERRDLDPVLGGLVGGEAQRHAAASARSPSACGRRASCRPGGGG